MYAAGRADCDVRCKLELTISARTDPMAFMSNLKALNVRRFKQHVLRAAFVSIATIVCLVGCGTDPDDDRVITVPEDSSGDSGTVDDVNETDDDIEDDVGDTEEDVEDTDDVLDVTDVEELDSEDIDTGEVEDTDSIDDASELCTTVCDCGDQVGDYCLRPPGVCFPVTIPQDRQYCCTSSTCPTGEICEGPDGSGGVCP